VKANALEWDDRFNEAIPIYRLVIESDGDFSARVGLASSMFYKGQRAEAQRMAKRLTASDDREKRQLQRLSDAIAREMRPRVQFGYDFYSDSDDNRFSRYSARYGVGIGNQDFAVQLGRTEIGNGSQADDLSLEADFHAAGPLGVAASIGVSRLQAAGDTSQFPIGHLQVHNRFARTFVSGAVSSEILGETPELVTNHVRRLTAGMELSQKITPRWSVGGAYTRMRFSDTNSANDAQARAEFALLTIPRVALGYQVRYADYARQSGTGFFDPSDLVSHRVSASLDLENRRFLAFIQIYGGHQKFVRNTYRTSEWAKGGRLSLGWKVTPKFTIEMTASAGDFATGSVSGFRYFTAGSRLGYRF